ncbi:hypothetical protein BKA63DRAFT_7289 [Paraphoma chrysanthemicola]|nr:hypothetical protein BKA63DRAFT_7289 [Paraphoma chrysanthemicola]
MMPVSHYIHYTTLQYTAPCTLFATHTALLSRHFQNPMQAPSFNPQHAFSSPRTPMSSQIQSPSRKRHVSSHPLPRLPARDKRPGAKAENDKGWQQELACFVQRRRRSELSLVRRWAGLVRCQEMALGIETFRSALHGDLQKGGWLGYSVGLQCSGCEQMGSKSHLILAVPHRASALHHLRISEHLACMRNITPPPPLRGNLFPGTPLRKFSVRCAEVVWRPHSAIRQPSVTVVAHAVCFGSLLVPDCRCCDGVYCMKLLHDLDALHHRQPSVTRHQPSPYRPHVRLPLTHLPTPHAAGRDETDAVRDVASESLGSGQLRVVSRPRLHSGRARCGVTQ